MSDLLLRIGASNLCLSAALALVAWGVQVGGKRPQLAHFVWLLVLAKLVTPPIFTAPLVPVPGLSATTVEASAPTSERAGWPGQDLAATEGDDLVAAGVDGELGLPLAASTRRFVKRLSSQPVQMGLAFFWLLGSACLLVGSLARIFRFHRLLRMASEPAPPALQAVAAEIGRRLGLRKTPTIYTCSAHLSPMVWWVGGRIRIIMPVSMSREMDSPELRLILAHELAHVRRRDHLVRWLEWLACVGFWWNPVAWWARRNLRTNEEVCCDALVLSSVKPDPHKYATTLLHAAEYLAYPTLRPPAMASGIASGGSLQRRFTLILSGNSLRRAHPVARAFASLCAVSLLSLGIVYAQDASSPKTARQRTVAETNDPSVKALRDLVASGALSVEGARQAHATTTPPEWVVLRYAAGAEGIDASVAAGTLSVEDAAVRKEEMGRTLRSLAFSLDVLAMSIDEAHIAVAVEAGELTREEAAERTAERERYARIHVYFERIGLTQEQSERVLGTLRRLAPEDLRERFPVFLRELGLSADQVEQVVGVARRLAHSRNASTGTPDWVGRVLDERGFEREQSGQVVRALERIVKELQREGELFELNPRMENYLRQTVRLTDEEIELVVGIARRLSAR